MKQKFVKGDMVRVASDLGPMRSHFQGDCDAIVIGSYADQYGGSNRDSYTLHIKGGGRTSWYYEKDLTLIAHNRLALLDQWQREADEIRRLHSDLYWIFDNPDALTSSSVVALAECFGLNDLWGPQGEGFVWVSNANYTMSVAKPFLDRRDLEGWVAFCRNHGAAMLAFVEQHVPQRMGE